MKKHTHKRIGFAASALSSAAICALAAGPGAAQDRTGTADEVQDSNRAIIVTGSRIPRADEVSISPVITIEREELSRFLATGVEDILNSYPQFTPDRGRASNNPGNGTAQLNLRGLGPARSLVLLDGRRLTGQGTGSAIDVNAIPSVLIDSVEIVTGGASTTYGSDAVTGAVNFKTRDFDGVSLTASADIYGAGDGESYNASLAAGTRFAEDRGQLSIYVDYLERTSLIGTDRAFTEFVIGENSATGELEPSGSLIIPQGIIFFPFADIDGIVTRPVFLPDGSVRPLAEGDEFNFAADNFLQTPLERWSAGALVDFEASDDLTLYAQFMFARTRSDRQLAPTTARLGLIFDIGSPFFNEQSRPILSAAADPDGDGIAQVFFGRRFTEVGPRTFTRTGHYYRALGGLTYALGGDWQLDAYGLFGRVDERNGFGNDVSRARLQQAVLVDPVTGACVNRADGCVAANIFGEGNLSDEAVAFLRIPSFESVSQSTVRIASLVATGPALELPAGDLYLSVGGEYRSNSASFTPAAVLATGDALGNIATGTSVDGSFDVAELFAETTVPLLANVPGAELLEIEGGVRYSDYSLGGDSWTWKAGGQWIPVEGLRFSASIQRAIRAPNIGELLTSAVSTQSALPGFFDFCLASNDPVGNGLEEVCVAQGLDRSLVGVYDAPPGVDLSSFNIPFQRVRGGNPELSPERADTFTLGAQYRNRGPVDFTASLDYFSIELDQAISADLNPFTVCASLRDPESPACQVIRRDPTGFVTSVDDKPVNIALARVRGLDFGVKASTGTTGWLGTGEPGRVSLRLLATHTLEFSRQATPAAPVIDCAGLFERDCSIGIGSTFPDFTANTVVAYDEGGFGASVRWRYIGPVDNGEPVFDAFSGTTRPPLAIPRIGARNYFDIAFTFDLSERLQFRAGVDNVFETSPPLLGRQAAQSNTDPSRYDIFGRRFFASIQFGFGGKGGGD